MTAVGWFSLAPVGLHPNLVLPDRRARLYGCRSHQASPRPCLAAGHRGLTVTAHALILGAGRGLSFASLVYSVLMSCGCLLAQRNESPKGEP